MTAVTTLLFGVHAHQPTGNFPEVIDHAHERCYRPFLKTLYRYPGFRFSAHFSGPLLDYLCERFPDDMRMLAEMSARGQVELFGAGDAEPVLAAIPERDRLGQIERLSAKLEKRFGRRPRGAWLTERVWESTVVPSLADCGIEYVTVDDYHFLCTGARVEELGGFFTTEENGRRLDLFPISEALRYRIPFAPAADALACIEDMAASTSGAAAIYFDDIEKFGVWPETYEWVYEKRWLETFIETVLGSAKVATQTFADYHAARRTRGTIYLPTVSYWEMNEWTLPPEAAATYAEVLAQARAAGRFDSQKPFLRGGIWKNFLTRYPEANWMHKRMLGLSGRLAALPASPQTEALRTLLYGAQANDAYWHGLFGGLYLPHLRRGIYRNLVSLEAALDRQQPRPPSSRSDADLDGVDELFLQNGRLQAVVKLDGTASVIEFDDYRLEQNFGDTLRRHGEHYHRSIESSAGKAAQGGGIASPHDRISFKHDVTAEEAAPDREPQSMLRDSLARPGESPEALGGYREIAAPVSGATAAFEAAPSGGRVGKQLALTDSTMTARYRVEGFAGGEFRTRLALAMPSCDGVAGRYVVAEEIPGGFGQAFDWARIGEVVLEDLFMRGRVTLSLEPCGRVSVRPYHSVSQSENGLERIMQSVAVEIAWPVATGDATITLAIRTSEAPL